MPSSTFQTQERSRFKSEEGIFPIPPTSKDQTDSKTAAESWNADSSRNRVSPQLRRFTQKASSR